MAFTLENDSDLSSSREQFVESYQGSLNSGIDSRSGSAVRTYDQSEATGRYLDACIFLWEGEYNDHFEVHPRTKQTVTAYRLVHSRWVKCLDLAAAVILLLLAVIEPPSIVINSLESKEEKDEMKTSLMIVQVSVELVCFMILWFGVICKMIWMGVRHYFSHKGLLIRFCVLIVVLVRTVSTPFCANSWCVYFDFIRAFRPVLLMDSYYCSSVRRTVRQVLQSLKSAFFVILFIIGFVMLAALLGLILFNDSRNNKYFADYLTSLVSLTVLFTTANSPDVMLPYYSQYWWAPSFFILFLCIGHYMMKALLLAVIFESYSAHVRNKFCRLYLHQREALFHTFYTLCGHPTELPYQGSYLHIQRGATYASLSEIVPMVDITFEQFKGLMRFYRPGWSTAQVQCFFKSLDCNGKGAINLSEFLQFYELRDVSWKPEIEVRRGHRWRGSVWNGIPALRKIAEKRYLDSTQFRVLEWTVGGLFTFFINVSLLGFFVLLVYQAADSGNPHPHITCMDLEERNSVYWSKVGFVILYSIEAIIKILTFGIKGYFTNNWNVFDFICVLAGLLDTILGGIVRGGEACSKHHLAAHIIFKFVFASRAIRLLRLFEISRKSREGVAALFAVIRRVLAVALVIILVFYALAVVGMDLFAHQVYQGCCQVYSELAFDVGEYFAGGKNSSNQYYLLNFDSIFQSYLTLFVLMVVNNWFVLMNGFTAATGTQWTRLYFILVYIVSLLVIDTVVSIIIDAFLFRMKAKEIGIEPKTTDLGLIPVKYEEHSTEAKDFPDSGTVVYYRGIYHASAADVKLQRYEDEIRPMLARQDRQQQRQNDGPFIQTHDSFGREGPVFVEDHY
jgi:two pore calcium channel protein 1